MSHSDKAKQRAAGEQKYCYECGNPWSDEYLLCRACGSSLRENNVARPTKIAKEDNIRYPWPWNNIPWPKQGAVGLIGGPGSGKSSLASLIRPKFWLSKEMEPKLIGAIFRRTQDDGFVPQVKMVHTAKDVREALRDIYEGPVVLDSATALESLGEALLAAEAMVSWAKDRNERSCTIVQVNKSGEAAGFMKIPHLFDVNVEVFPEDYGLRTFNLVKSRWCGLETTYFTFGPDGKITMPMFDGAYSVEGNPGSYSLHPYPLSGAKWSAPLELLEEVGEIEGGTACAAAKAGYTKSGFIEPNDRGERRRFAERHGLRWIEVKNLEIVKKDEE